MSRARACRTHLDPALALSRNKRTCSWACILVRLFSKKEAELRIGKLDSVFSFYYPLSKKKEQLSIRLEKKNSRDDIAIPFFKNYRT
jgi:hypothetical protein